MPIRLATAADLDALFALANACFGVSAYSRRQWEEMQSTPERTLMLAEAASGEITALLSLVTVAGETQIETLAVAEAWRRHGVAGELLQAGLDRARADASRLVYLEVRGTNLAAVAFYKKHGFAVTGRRSDYYRHPTGDALLMSREL